MCITDADPSSHTPSEGFGGGTLPLYAEVHVTAWAYDNEDYKKAQFIKWEVINKSANVWDSTIFSVVSDPDLGDATDDYIGCDTTLGLGYCYNSDDNDGDGSGLSYGANPPAVGQMFLECASGSKMTAFTYFSCSGCPGGFPCETGASSPTEAYNYMNGIKKDYTPWVISNTNPPRVTKFTYSGDPESGAGWTEFGGRIENCGGSLTGTYTVPVQTGDRRMITSYKPVIMNMHPGDTQVITMAQLIQRVFSHKNSVTKLKDYAEFIKDFCESGFVIGIQPVSNIVPNTYSVEQNYPNPFNPLTKINFSLPKAEYVLLKIYDVLGREVSSLVNENLKAGEYSVDWNAATYPSGVYFYSLQTDNYTETKKMVLVK